MRFVDDHALGESVTVLETDQDYIDAYLDYRNNFLTVARFAEHYGWNVDQGAQVITKGREIAGTTDWFR